MISRYHRRSICIATVLIGFMASPCFADPTEIKVSLRSQTPDPAKSDAYTTQQRDEVWKTAETAVIVCDMWDSHHCYRAVLRENQMVPRMDQLLTTLRDRGVTVIHAPSSCVDSYKDHAARQRALAAPKTTPPEENQRLVLLDSSGRVGEVPVGSVRWR